MGFDLGSLGGAPSMGGLGDPGAEAGFNLTGEGNVGYGFPLGGGYDPSGMNMGLPNMPNNWWRGGVPSYFRAPPAKLGSLSPMALAYLAQLYPQGVGWMNQTYGNVSSTSPTVAYQPGPNVSATEVSQMPYSMASGAQAPTMYTEAVAPQAPSAQMWKQLQGEGALPVLQSYVTDILQIPWEQFVGQMQGMWPSAETTPAARWKVGKQK